MSFIKRFWSVSVVLSLTVLASCTAPTAQDPEMAEEHWDSADGNPTHPTHSTMAEIAIKTNRAAFPEVAEFEQQIVQGANLELHDLVHKTHEALRLELGGNNWAADHPELLWQKARASYAAGDKAGAYLYVGIMLHYVQDMGVPAHAFHVIHQSGPRDWDHLEVLGFFDFHADMRTAGTPDPELANPIDYVEWSARTSREHFQTAFPGATYDRKYFPQAYADMTDEHWAFLRRREADCVWATSYALRSAARALKSE
jgi:hypothetical protein